MNKKNKGFTTIELITSFTLASVIMLILFNIILILKDNLSKVNAKTNMLVEKDNLSYNINKRFKEKELSSVTLCDEGDKCYEFKYSDDTSDKLIYSNNDKTIIFNNYTFDIIDGITVEEPTVTEHYDTMSSTTYNGYFIINIPIKLDNKDYSIKINKHFNTESLVINFPRYEYDQVGNKYTIVKYLESTGTQYIDTKIVPKSTTKLITKFSITALGEKNFCNNGWGANNNREAFMWGYDSGVFSSYVSSNFKIQKTNTPLDFDEHLFELESGSQKFDGEIIGNSVIGNTASNGQYMYLFGLHAGWVGNKLYSPCMERISFLQIYDSNTLVRDYIPVIDSSSTPCLFDKVEKKCYYNQGTGEFLWE